MGINYAFKYHRFIHAQMSANPPSVIPVPTSSDYKDRRAAKVADAFIQHGRRKLKLQERVDLASLATLTYGCGVIKTAYDPCLGDVWEVNPDTEEIVMQGDISIQPVLVWNMYFDHEAELASEIRYTFERHLMPFEEAISRFPKYKDKLKEIKGLDKKDKNWWDEDDGELTEDLVEIYEYYEKALPWNGMDGRHCYLLSDGTVLGGVRPNKTPDAELPYDILTDVDVPGSVYGKTFIDYIVKLQDILNKIDSTVLDNVQAHGTVRMVVFDAAEMPDDGVTNNGWEVMNLRGTAGQAPMFINPPTLMPDLYRLRDAILVGMESLAGANDSMFGQVKREMSGFSLQTAINAGNMVRRRLFNKYSLFVESIYRKYLKLIQKHYNDKRKVFITGEENAVSVAYYSGMDLDGGFDLEYGTSFSLDPASRREEIMQLIPFLKEAGYSMKQILGMLKLNEVGGMIDMVETGKRRQMEIFDEMIATYEQTRTVLYIAPEKNEDGASMLEAAKEFRMSMIFKSLDKELKDAIDRHIDERIEMVASTAAGTAAGAPAPQGLPPMGGMSMPPIPMPGM